MTHRGVPALRRRHDLVGSARQQHPGHPIRAAGGSAYLCWTPAGRAGAGSPYLKVRPAWPLAQPILSTDDRQAGRSGAVAAAPEPRAPRARCGRAEAAACRVPVARGPRGPLAAGRPVDVRDAAGGRCPTRSPVAAAEQAAWWAEGANGRAAAAAWSGAPAAGVSGWEHVRHRARGPEPARARALPRLHPPLRLWRRPLRRRRRPSPRVQRRRPRRLPELRPRPWSSQAWWRPCSWPPSWLWSRPWPVWPPWALPRPRPPALAACGWRDPRARRADGRDRLAPPRCPRSASSPRCPAPSKGRGTPCLSARALWRAHGPGSSQPSSF